MAREFTFDNLALVVQAICEHLHHQKMAQKLVIGYDQRFLSDKFALEAASVVTANNIQALLIDKPSPTPTTAFAIVEHQADGALMITASHNPPEYNGIKFIPYYAGPATPEITDGIEGYLKGLRHQDIKRKCLETARTEGLLQYIDPMQSYLECLRKLVDWQSINRAKLKVIHDPMFGAGMGYLDKLFTGSTVEMESIHCTCDPLFGGGMPEPTGKSLSAMVALVKQRGAHLGLALDGDADRFGAVDSDGKYYTPNQILSMLLYHLIKNRGWKGPVARTVATTHLLDRICLQEGLRVFETPVGFKFIGQHLLNDGCILGGEESGGLSIRGHIPEKDGILASLLIVEMISSFGLSLGEIMEEVYQSYGKLVNERLDIKVSFDQKAKALRMLKEQAPTSICGQPVVEKLCIDGTKLKLAGGSWVLIRPSGTEPLLRVYAEAGTTSELKAIQSEIRRVLGV